MQVVRNDAYVTRLASDSPHAGLMSSGKRVLTHMRYGIYASVFGEFADPRTLSDLAHMAEAAGWDGFFLWDHILYTDTINFTDPWISLAAMACRTERIRLGPLITPLPRRRPWTVARQAVALDHLSGGRLIQGVGIGGDWWREYSAFGEPRDDKRHSVMLDEGIAVLTGLWSGEPFTFHGEYYQVDDVRFLPRPLQSPRIPLWVAGYWPHKPAFRRAARWDGVFPYRESGVITPNDITDIRAYVGIYRESEAPIEIILDTAMAVTSSPSAMDEYNAAGVTWWLECFDQENTTEELRRRILEGPGKVRTRRPRVRTSSTTRPRKAQ